MELTMKNYLKTISFAVFTGIFTCGPIMPMNSPEKILKKAHNAAEQEYSQKYFAAWKEFNVKIKMAKEELTNAYKNTSWYVSLINQGKKCNTTAEKEYENTYDAAVEEAIKKISVAEEEYQKKCAEADKAYCNPKELILIQSKL
jgi:hypothetical protein